MKKLDFDRILYELDEREAITLKKDSLGLRKVEYIMRINSDKLK